jgi:hypothetical protein
MAGIVPLICPTREAEYFSGRDGQTFGDLPVGLFWRTHRLQLVIA